LPAEDENQVAVFLVQDENQVAVSPGEDENQTVVYPGEDKGIRTRWLTHLVRMETR
jgi:hypothetical protein